MAAYPDDQALLDPPEGTSTAAAAARRRSNRYREALESFDKLRACPLCQSPTGMRKYPAQFGRIGIVCFNDASCDWNLAHAAAPIRTPLPFLLRSEEHTSELQSLMRISYAAFCLKKKNTNI